VDENGPPTPQFVAQLPNSLEKRQALDIAYGAADFDQDEIVSVGPIEDEFFDGVGDVRDDLDGRAEIIAPPLLANDRLVDAAGGDVVGLGRGHAGKALVMPEVEIGLGAVIGDEYFAVLLRAHRARINIDVGV